MSVYLISGQRFTFLKYKKDVVYIVVSGIAMGVSWICLYEAYQQIGVGIASLFYYCGPVIVMALSPITFGEKLTRYKVVSFLIVLAGIVCVNGSSSNGMNISGILCGCAAAFGLALLVITNKMAKQVTGLENSLIQLVTSFVTVAIFVGIKDGYAIHLQPQEWLWILALGLINTGIGCYFYFSSIGELPVQTVAILGYLEPLSAVVFSVILLHEVMTITQMLGAVMIIGGAVGAELIADHTKSPVYKAVD